MRLDYPQSRHVFCTSGAKLPAKMAGVSLLPQALTDNTDDTLGQCQFPRTGHVYQNLVKISSFMQKTPVSETSLSTPFHNDLHRNTIGKLILGLSDYILLVNQGWHSWAMYINRLWKSLTFWTAVNSVKNASDLGHNAESIYVNNNFQLKLFLLGVLRIGWNLVIWILHL